MFGVFSKIWKNPVSHDLKIDSICVIKDWTLLTTIKDQLQGVPKKHGNSVTNWISSLLWISIVIPNFKSHNTIMSARVYFMERVKDCKDVSIMSPQDDQWGRTSLLCLYAVIFLFSCTTVCSQNINKQNLNIADETLTDYSFLSRYHHRLWVSLY